MTKKRERAVATITIVRPGKMPKRLRRTIARWMRRQAAFFEEYGREYVDKGSYRARYMEDGER